MANSWDTAVVNGKRVPLNDVLSGKIGMGFGVPNMDSRIAPGTGAMDPYQARMMAYAYANTDAQLKRTSGRQGTLAPTGGLSPLAAYMNTPKLGGGRG